MKMSVGPQFETLPPRRAEIAPGFPVSRVLPQRTRRTVGPWCFADYYRAEDAALDVLAHPHIGLQTVSWLFHGALDHYDSLGNALRVVPGQLNLMTAGRGIAHAEMSVQGQRDAHGLQLWIALPEEQRRADPHFEQHVDLPAFDAGGAIVRVVIGDSGAHRSPARTYAPTIALDVAVTRTGAVGIPVNPAHEHAVLLVDGRASISDTPLEEATLYYLGQGRESIAATVDDGARLFVLGGAPFGERLVMWWNFVARSAGEIELARAEWMHDSFATIAGFEDRRLVAPPLPPHLLAR
jgi:quercetin 2,3-dioxygenase